MGSFGILRLSAFGSFVCDKDNIAYKDILGNLEDVPAFLLYAFAYGRGMFSYEGMPFAFAALESLEAFVFAALAKDYNHIHIPAPGVKVRVFLR